MKLDSPSPLWASRETSVTIGPTTATRRSPSSGASILRSFRSAAALLVLVAPLVVAAPAQARELRYDLVPDGAITLGAAALFAADRVFAHELAPTECRFCGGNAFDRTIATALLWKDHELAGRLSDLGAFVVLPAAAIGWSFVEDGGKDGLIDTLILVETVALTIVTVDVLKIVVARERPRETLLSESDLERRPHPEEANVSFPSGHTAIAFATVATLATITDLRGRDPLPIWLIGIPSAAAVGYFRVASSWHWATDVIGGAVVGTAAGVFLPRLLHSRSETSKDPRPSAPMMLSFGGPW